MQFDLFQSLDLKVFVVLLARMTGLIFIFQPLQVVPGRIKIFLVVFLSLLIAPLLQNEIAEKLQNKDIEIVFLFEFLIGAFLSSVISLYFNALMIAANIISTQIGLSSVIAFDPVISEQSDVLSRLFSFLAIVLCFASGIHLRFISFVVESYRIFPDFLCGDAVLFLLQSLRESFLLALKMSSAFICSGTVLYIAVAILGKLAPQIQFFFILSPLQIWLGTSLLALMLRDLISFYISRFN